MLLRLTCDVKLSISSVVYQNSICVLIYDNASLLTFLQRFAKSVLIINQTNKY